MFLKMRRNEILWDLGIQMDHLISARGPDQVIINTKDRGARGVMVIDVGYGHGDTSSNPGQDWLHFT